eukprot:scaffold304_cov248-Pinguiococcus_pyrenoidosus.AAC.1
MRSALARPAAQEAAPRRSRQSSTERSMRLTRRAPPQPPSEESARARQCDRRISNLGDWEMEIGRLGD